MIEAAEELEGNDMLRSWKTRLGGGYQRRSVARWIHDMDSILDSSKFAG